MKGKRIWISAVSGLLAVLLVLGIAPNLPRANAESSGEFKEQINELEEEQAAMEAELEELKAQQLDNLSEIQDISSQKSVIEQEVGILELQVENINAQISAYALLIADKQEELDEAESYLAELNELYKERIRAMEENGDISYWSVLFEANSFFDLLDRLSMINEIAAADARRLEELRAAAQAVSEAKEELETEKAALEETRQSLADAQAELEEKEAEAEELLLELLARGEEFEALVAEGEDAISELEAEIAAAEKEYKNAKYLEWLATSVATTQATTQATTATTPTSSSSSGGSGGTTTTSENVTWMVPVSYVYVSSAFGYRIHPVYGTWKMHNGVDLATSCPNNIYATRAGVVTTATYSSSAGYYVVINHGDGYSSVYMHMCKSPYVSVGDYVSQGQVIGCVGTTGVSTGVHLHFGISYNGTYVNPMDYIG